MRKLPSSGMKYPKEQAELKKGRQTSFTFLLSLILLLLPLYGMGQEVNSEILIYQWGI